ncbi:PEP-CTERM sorting domain-containing protein [Merismopedia glauca]|uniref:PEP-CTERM sorting domain-containing protein n=1 Tax=Merismopedia glauca TaxID=292586 RepID=UPI0015E6AA0E|nr:PEP-CTERM sorting domain-containing protein [Merismopedia glauca]
MNDFSFDVTDAGNGKVLFQINNAANNGAIGSIYWENTGNLLSNMVLNVGNIGNVNFKNISPGNLPQGNKIAFIEAFGARFQSGGSKRINGGESLGITFTGNFNSVINALQSEDLRVGIHVQELPQGQSDSFVSDGGETQVPEPLSILGTGVALGFGILFKKKGVSGNKKTSQL